jgi:hypothetical protein
MVRSTKEGSIRARATAGASLRHFLAAGENAAMEAEGRAGLQVALAAGPEAIMQAETQATDGR